MRQLSFELGRPKIYLELGKVRLSGLVVATTASGYYMGCAHVDVSSREAEAALIVPHVQPATLGYTLTGTALAALSANSINQWIEATCCRRLREHTLTALVYRS